MTHERSQDRPARWPHLCAPLVAAVAALVVVSMGGCQRYHDVDAFLMQRDRMAGAEPYTVAPPDTLQVISRQVPEIDKTHVTVSPDGTVFLPLIGEMHVAGKTAAEIAAMIEDRALEYYQEADVVVQVVGFRSKHLYVFGEVGAPGRYPYTGSDTVLDVLARAQPTRLADPNRIQVIRPKGEGEPPERMTIELGKWVRQGHVDRNAQIAEGDIIYVPANGLASVGLALQQLLLPIQPAAATVRGPVNIDDSVTHFDGANSH